jgi:pimeloyl-ACP methyl ester carboxylesterase
MRKERAMNHLVNHQNNGATSGSGFEQPFGHVSAGDGKLAYYRFGHGPDVVLVHGWPLHAATFRRLAPALAKQFTVHAFDLPGTGHTEWTGAVSLESNAIALRRAIDSLGLARFALVAHDSGGVSARLAAADDTRVQAIVLEGSEIPGHHPWQVQAIVTAAKRPLLMRALSLSMALGPVRRSSFAYGGCFTDAGFADGEFGQIFLRPLLESRRVREGQMAVLHGFDFGLVDRLSAVHARIHAPVLCIWGTDDPFFPIAKARAMLPQFGGPAELVEIVGAKLFAHEDHPEEFARHAAAFLARSFVRERESGSLAT